MTNGIVFVIDSSDTERMSEVKECLSTILNEEELFEVPLLIFANKCDIANITLEKIKNDLGLAEIKTRKCNIFASNAVKGIGLMEGFDWLIE